MSYISSINFKKSTSFQVFHNANIRPSYAIGGEIECTLKGYEAEALKNELIAEAKKAYEANRHKKAPKFKAKSYEWSAVCNIKPETTMQDLENLAKHFNEKYGFQCYQIAIHRDEGHINEQGEKVINHHAHLEFITLDKNTGKNIYNRANITPTKLRQMQTEVADILGMERGVDKRISGAKRVEPRLFAKMKEEERKNQEALKLEIAQNKKEIESTNKLLEEYDELLEKEKQKTKDLTAEIESLQETKSNSFTSYQNKIAFNIYKSNLKFDFKGFYVDSRDEKVIFKKSGINVEDSGNKLTAKGTDTKEQVKLMLEIAQAKKWNLALLEVSGDDEFKQETQRQINEILLKKQKEKEEQELKTKKELSDLKLELEKEQQKSKDLIAENNELKSESNDLKSKLTIEIESFKGKNEALKTQVKDLKSANELLEKNKNTQITTLQNDLKQEKEKSKKALAELEKLRKESKNKGLPKEYFQGINQLKKLLKEGNYIEFDKSYESFQNQWKDYNEVTKEIFEDLIYFNDENIDLEDKILDLEEEIESLQQKTKDLTAKNNELKEKIATKEANEKNRNAEIEILKNELKKEKETIEALKKETNDLKS
ncbi:MAG: hypothetical protein LUC16_01245, partial [Coprobacillus sp.]|nr:hypothetical protein [Coprobacillus sp.]